MLVDGPAIYFGTCRYSDTVCNISDNHRTLSVYASHANLTHIFPPSLYTSPRLCSVVIVARRWRSDRRGDGCAGTDERYADMHHLRTGYLTLPACLSQEPASPRRTCPVSPGTLVSPLPGGSLGEVAP